MNYFHSHTVLNQSLNLVKQILIVNKKFAKDLFVVCSFNFPFVQYMIVPVSL